MFPKLICKPYCKLLDSLLGNKVMKPTSPTGSKCSGNVDDLPSFFLYHSREKEPCEQHRRFYPNVQYLDDLLGRGIGQNRAIEDRVSVVPDASDVDHGVNGPPRSLHF